MFKFLFTSLLLLANVSFAEGSRKCFAPQHVGSHSIVMFPTDSRIGETFPSVQIAEDAFIMSLQTEHLICARHEPSGPDDHPYRWESVPADTAPATLYYRGRNARGGLNVTQTSETIVSTVRFEGMYLTYAHFNIPLWQVLDQSEMVHIQNGVILQRWMPVLVAPPKQKKNYEISILVEFRFSEVLGITAREVSRKVIR